MTGKEETGREEGRKENHLLKISYALVKYKRLIEESSYHQDHGSTFGNAHKTYEGFVRCKCVFGKVEKEISRSLISVSIVSWFRGKAILPPGS